MRVARRAGEQVAEQLAARGVGRNGVAVVEQEAGRHRGVLGERTAQRPERRVALDGRRVEADGFGEAAREPRHLRVGRTAREEDVDTAWIRQVVGDGLAQQRGLAEPGARHERDHADFEPAAHVPEQARPRRARRPQPSPGGPLSDVTPVPTAPSRDHEVHHRADPLAGR